MLTCVLLFIPLFALSACPSLTCGLQFSRDITALVRLETTLTFLLISVSLMTPLEHVFAHIEAGKPQKKTNILPVCAVKCTVVEHMWVILGYFPK